MIVGLSMFFKVIEVVVCCAFEIHTDMNICEVFAPVWYPPLEVPWETIN